CSLAARSGTTFITARPGQRPWRTYLRPRLAPGHGQGSSTGAPILRASSMRPRRRSRATSARLSLKLQTHVGGTRDIPNMQNREASSTEARLRYRAPTLKEPATAGGLYRYIVLGLLRDGAARHGYALMKDYRQRSGSQIGSGRFYGKLQRLAA